MSRILAGMVVMRGSTIWKVVPRFDSGLVTGAGRRAFPRCARRWPGPGRCRLPWWRRRDRTGASAPRAECPCRCRPLRESRPARTGRPGERRPAATRRVMVPPRLDAVGGVLHQVDSTCLICCVSARSPDGFAGFQPNWMPRVSSCGFSRSCTLWRICSRGDLAHLRLGGRANWRKSLTIRSRRLISSPMTTTSSLLGEVGRQRFFRLKSRNLSAVSGLRISWATPAARVPREASFSCRSSTERVSRAGAERRHRQAVGEEEEDRGKVSRSSRVRRTIATGRQGAVRSVEKGFQEAFCALTSRSHGSAAARRCRGSVPRPRPPNRGAPPALFSPAAGRRWSGRRRRPAPRPSPGRAPRPWPARVRAVMSSVRWRPSG